MKTHFLLLALAATVVSSHALAAEKPAAPAQIPTDPKAPDGHTLRGVVVGVLKDRSSLLVKHDEIPGVMRAMTMAFKVETSTLEKAQEGDTVKGRMSRRDDGWYLQAVEIEKKK